MDPFGPAAQHQLMVTNLRVRLLQRQPCPCRAKHPGAAALPTEHYAIYDLIVKGSCLCNGHADQCVPARGYRPGLEKADNMVSDSIPGSRNIQSSQLHRNLQISLEKLWVLLPLLSCVQVCDAKARGCSKDWILDRSFTHHYRDLRLWNTLIKVPGLML